MVKQKKGWIRIMEATVAITIFATVLLVVYSQQAYTVNKAEPIKILQEQILGEIALNDGLRQMVLEENETLLENYFNDYFPYYLNYSIRICNLTIDAEPCKMANYNDIYDKEIFVENTIISGNLTYYDPKFVNIFVWEA